jgi:hypothetical protein
MDDGWWLCLRKLGLDSSIASSAGDQGDEGIFPNHNMHAARAHAW